MRMWRKLMLIGAFAAVMLTSTGCGALLIGAAVAVPCEVAKCGVGLTFFTVGGSIDLMDKANKASYNAAKRKAELQIVQAKAMSAMADVGEEK